MHKKGDRVKREIDINNHLKGYKFGKIISRYSQPSRKYGETVLGPYPELYKVQWDDGSIEKGFLPHGLINLTRCLTSGCLAK